MRSTKKATPVDGEVGRVRLIAEYGIGVPKGFPKGKLYKRIIYKKPRTVKQ